MKSLLFSAGLILARGDRFFVIETPYDEAGAETACTNNGGTLASIHSADEYAEASGKCVSVYGKGNTAADGCWLGIKDNIAEGKWYNIDGSVADYLAANGNDGKKGVFPWHSGEPNNAGGEDCAHIWRPQKWDVNDISCGDKNFPVCRYDTPTADNRAGFFATGVKGTRDTAQASCEAAGGTLADIRNDAEFAEAAGLCITVHDSGADGCWIGVHDINEEDKWIEMDGSANSYLQRNRGQGGFPWWNGEPNNSGNEDCVHIWFPQYFQLNDISCGDTNYAICRSVGFSCDGHECPNGFTCHEGAEGCLRDCGLFAIDGFLTDCSTEHDDVLNALADFGSRVQQLEDRVDANEGAIDALSGRLDAAEGTITQQTADISANGGDIATNAGEIAANGVKIGTNGQNIGTNTGNIGQNAADISTNAGNIQTNAGDINTNAGNIQTNAGNIQTNADDISANDGDISSLDGRVAALEKTLASLGPNSGLGEGDGSNSLSGPGEGSAAGATVPIFDLTSFVSKEHHSDLIVLLVAANMMLCIGLCAVGVCLCAQSNGATVLFGKRQKYEAVRAYSSADENAHLNDDDNKE